MYRAIRFIDRMTEDALMLAFLLLFLIGGCTRYDTVPMDDADSGAARRSFRPLATGGGECRAR